MDLEKLEFTGNNSLSTRAYRILLKRVVPDIFDFSELKRNLLRLDKIRTRVDRENRRVDRCPLCGRGGK